MVNVQCPTRNQLHIANIAHGFVRQNKSLILTDLHSFQQKNIQKRLFFFLFFSLANTFDIKCTSRLGQCMPRLGGGGGGAKWQP